jgi:endoglucanase
VAAGATGAGAAITDRRRPRTVAAALAIGLLATACAAEGATAPTTTTSTTVADDPTREAALTSARQFLDTYVDGEGRVVRHDQGGDTVSEGQAYALLLAVAADDEAAVDRVWAWTAANLQRPDRLLAWRWADGAVVDDDPASDADLDAARALLLAGERFDRPDLVDAGEALADAVAQHEVHGADLVAGPWATVEPVTVNPSYASPRAYDVLAEHRPDGPWQDLADAVPSHLGQLGLAEGSLPPDWAVLDPGGLLVPSGPPADRTAEPQFGFDAARVPVRLAESCRQVDRDLASALALGEGPALPRGLDSSTGGGSAPHAVGAVALAAVADARGDDAGAGRWLAEAERLEASNPSYYGAAWLALGRVLLTTDLLGAC